MGWGRDPSLLFAPSLLLVQVVLQGGGRAEIWPLMIAAVGPIALIGSG